MPNHLHPDGFEVRSGHVPLHPTLVDRECPACGARMVRWTPGAMTEGFPPRFLVEWRCGCGAVEASDETTGTRERRPFEQLWALANAAPKEQAEA